MLDPNRYAWQYHLVKTGRIAAIRVGSNGGAIRIRERDYSDFLEKNRTRGMAINAIENKPSRVCPKHLHLNVHRAG